MKVLILASAAALSLAATAFAQEAPAQIVQLPGPPAATQITDADIQKVAAIAADVKALNSAHQPKIAAAEASAKIAAQKELDTATRASLARHGLSVDRYNEIARAAYADVTLANRIGAANATATGAP